MISKASVVVGSAMDSKSGAVLLTQDGDIFFIEGLDYWPANVVGKNVSVKGIRARRKVIPDPRVDSQGAVSQGVAGEQNVLEHATWTVSD